MATINNRKIIDSIIRNNGFYEDDPQVEKIVEYKNAWGNTTWGVVWSNERKEVQNRYEIETDYIIAPKVIWQRENN